MQLEMLMIGRNDDYEEGWSDRLQACIAYNRRLFEGSPIDYRVVFCEWNSLADRPLLSPKLVERFPFLRAVVLDRAIHQALCLHPPLTVMMNFAANPAIRTSSADYVLSSGGDILLSRAIAGHIIRNGLRPNCLYRAERVTIRNTIDFARGMPEEIENPHNVVSIDSCTSEWTNQPPFTNASGDFILMDRLSLMGLRGFDESIRHARLHLDSRLCWSTQRIGMHCELLGQIYHIDHRRSFFRNTTSYPGAIYSLHENLPYLNPVDWGLADADWQKVADRLWHVRPATSRRVGRSYSIPETLSREQFDTMNAVTQRVLDERRKRQQLSPSPRLRLGLWKQALDLSGVRLHPTCTEGSLTGAKPLVITTGPAIWEWTALFAVQPWRYWYPRSWSWVRLKMRVRGGQIHIGALAGNDIVSEKPVVPSEHVTEVVIPVPRGATTQLLFRNSNSDGPSVVEIFQAQIVYQSPDPRVNERRELKSFAEWSSRFVRSAVQTTAA